jgi:cell division protease FtsH
MSLPAQDRYSYDKDYMLNQISMLFGGRIAEEVFMHQMTTGASNDFERATHIARDMVMRYGMTDALGPMVYAENEGEVFPGPLGDQDHQHERRDHAEGGCRSAPHHRRAVRAGAPPDRRAQRQDARHGQGLARMGNHRQRPARRHHGRASEPRPPKDWTPRTPLLAVGAAAVAARPVAKDPAPTAA